MSYTYYKSLSADFPTGLIPNQLMTTIIAEITTPLQSVNIMGDVVSIIFDEAIPDESVLNTIIQNYTPVEYNYNVPYLVNNVLTTRINNQEYKYFGNEYREIIIAPDSQAHFNSLSAAILAHNVPNQVFIIYPGTYIENNPIILPEGTTIKSVGSVSNTILVAQDYTQDLVRLNQKCKADGITFAGAHGSGARGLYFDASLSNGAGNITVISECFIVDCDIAIEADGKNIVGMADTLYAEKLVISSTNHILSKGVFCKDGGQFITSVCYVVGVPGTYPILNAYDCQGENSKISLSTASVWFCNKGLYIDDNGNAEISLLNAQYNNIGVQIGTTGTQSRISTSSLVIKNSSTYDFDIQASDANVEIYSSFLDDSKINNPNDVNVIIRYTTKNFDVSYQCFTGDVLIGNAMIPAKMAIGSGLYIVSGAVVYSNSNLELGTWVDNTTDALSGSEINFDLFQGTSANQCAYIGANNNIYGIKINVTTATPSITTFNDLIFEYWDGSNWTEFNVMQIFPETPTETYVDSFVSLVSKFHIRFGLNSSNTFAFKTLNGVNKKWIRLRLANNISGIPICNYVKVHTSATIIGKDGSIMYMGNARNFKSMKLTTYPSNSSPGSQELYIASDLSIRLSNNVFTYNSITQLGFSFKMPVDIDTSFPIKLHLGLVGDNNTSGNVSWTLKYVRINPGSNLYLNATDANNNPNPNIKTLTAITTINQQNTYINQTINIDVSRIPSNPAVSAKNYIYLTLIRNGTDPTDTYPGNVVLSVLDANYMEAFCGGHIDGF